MKHTYKPACVLVAIVLPVPVLATLITVALYIILGQQFNAPGWLNLATLLIGLGATVVIWLIAAFFFRGATSAQYANRLSYNAIMQELRRLEINYDTIELPKADESDEVVEVIEVDEASGAVQPVNTRQVAETEQANGNAGALARGYDALYGENEDESIENILHKNGMQWILSSGYVGIWSRLQTADEEMITLLPIETVQYEADYDLLRLQGSTIPNSQHWIDVINEAKATLDKHDKNKKSKKADGNAAQQAAHSSTQHTAHSHAGTLQAAPDGKEQQLLGQAFLDLIKATFTSSTLPLDDADIPKSFGPALFSIIKSAVSPPAQPRQTEEQARANLRQVRIAINSYITNRWIGLIQSRNRLMGTAFVTSIFVYILFAIAIIGNAAPQSLIAALAFYFVGATVGMFVRLAPRFSVSSKPAQAKSQSQAQGTSAKTGSSSQAHSTSAKSSQSSQARGKTAGQRGSSRSDSSSNNKSSSSDDYGLTLARILVTPVFSGLASLIGVGLATMLSITLFALTPGPSNTTALSTGAQTAVVATAAPGASSTQPSIIPQGERSIPNYPSLDQIYNLSNNVQGVIFAAIFGFLPSLIISSLQKEASALQSEIQSTDPGEQDSSS